MKRALHLIYSHYESDPRPRRFAEELRDADWEVSVIALASAGDPPSSDVDGIHVDHFDVDRYRGQSVRQYLGSYARFLGDTVDLIDREFGEHG